VRFDPGCPAERTRLPAAVLGAILQRWPALLDAPHLALELDTEAFTCVAADGRRHKLGLGSSAALTVALAAAVTRAWGAAPEPAVLQRLCLDAHRAFQQGAGSGVDVLTAIHGGLLVTRVADGELAGERLTWPEGLHLVVVWTGQPASTPALIGRYRAFCEAEPVVSRHYAVRLAEAAVRSAAAWRGGEAGAVLEAVAHYAECLREFDAAGRLGIWTAEHVGIAGLADSAGATYKPSGAGGGDLGFALTGRQSVAASLRQRCAERGWLVVDLPWAVPGLQVTGA
jgi:phosphomevalonate kinase